jgi:hypothetical protein
LENQQVTDDSTAHAARYDTLDAQKEAAMPAYHLHLLQVPIHGSLHSSTFRPCLLLLVDFAP